MTVFYMAHPIEDLQRAERWLLWLNRMYGRGIAIVAPYLHDAGRTDAARRLAVLRRCNGIFLVGGGGEEERQAATEFGLMIMDHSDLGSEPPY